MTITMRLYDVLFSIETEQDFRMAIKVLAERQMAFPESIGPTDTKQTREQVKITGDTTDVSLASFWKRPLKSTARTTLAALHGQKAAMSKEQLLGVLGVGFGNGSALGGVLTGIHKNATAIGLTFKDIIVIDKQGSGKKLVRHYRLALRMRKFLDSVGSMEQYLKNEKGAEDDPPPLLALNGTYAERNGQTADLGGDPDRLP